jgi:NhaA family Na+:H+ antiporter
VRFPGVVARTVVRPIRAFVQTEATSSLVLLAAATAAMVWVNSPWDDSYQDAFEHVISVNAGLFSIELDVRHWINDALMTPFFFVVALEIKREVFRGELAGHDRALLPVFAALGGMVVSGLIYAAINAGGAGAHGWGIPMATDLAFALGLVALLGRRIPSQLRVFLLAMAIVDDMLSILVLVFFYSGEVDFGWLGAAGGILGVTYSFRLLGVRSTMAYVPAGICLWLAVFESGVSTTLAGVSLALLIPLHENYGWNAVRANLDTLSKLLHRSERRDADIAAGRRDSEPGAESPLERLERIVHPYTSFVIVPIFALANTGIALKSHTVNESLTSATTLGIVLGRVIGKPLGVLLFSWVAWRTGLATLPRMASWGHILGVGMLGGIGFTVALYVNERAFDDPLLTDEGKLGILAGSLLSGLLGSVALWFAAGREGEATDR